MDQTLNPKISVCIPVYEMPGGIEFLRESFDILSKQSFKNFEVVITDDSVNNEIKEFCANYKGLNIRYIKNVFIKGMAGNTNTSILYANGELIKILYQDDYLAHPYALKEIVDAFKPEDNWLVTECIDTNSRIHKPYYNDQIHMGRNTIGSPSVLTIRNNKPLLFENKLTWVLDCDYYFRLNQKYGPPKILNDVNVVIRIGKHQTTQVLSNERKNSEVEYLIKKHDSRLTSHN